MNCTSFAGAEDLSHMARIIDVLNLDIHDVQLPDQPRRTYTVKELAAIGHIVFEPRVR